MFSLRISLLFVLQVLALMVSFEYIRGDRHDSGFVLLFLSDLSAIQGAHREKSNQIESPLQSNIREQLTEPKPSHRTLGPLLFGNNVPTLSNNIMADPTIQVNDVNREFLKALIMALQAQPTENIKPVTENQEDEQTNLVRIQQDARPTEATMIDDKVTREFIIGFIKGIQASTPEENMQNKIA